MHFSATMNHIEPGIFVRHDPLGEPVPVVFDSPHSGTDYPPDFGYACPSKLLRQAEDAQNEFQQEQNTIAQRILEAVRTRLTTTAATPRASDVHSPLAE